MEKHQIETIKRPYNKSGISNYAEFFLNELKLQNHLKSFKVVNGRITCSNIMFKDLIRIFELILNHFNRDIRAAKNFLFHTRKRGGDIFIEKLDEQNPRDYYSFTKKFLKKRSLEDASAKSAFESGIYSNTEALGLLVMGYRMTKTGWGYLAYLYMDSFGKIRHSDNSSEYNWNQCIQSDNECRWKLFSMEDN